MAVLTSDFLENRRKSFRYKKFVLPVGIFLVVAASLAAGFYLYEKSEPKNSAAVAGAEETTVAGLLPKEWLLKYFGTENENDAKVGGRDGDPDEDILTNDQEFFFATDPTNPDSDGDGQWDGAEVAINSNPLGEGELYSSKVAEELVERYLEQSRLEEFKKENIQKQVLGILNPPDPAAVEINLPDPKTLKVVRDSSVQAVEKYLQEADAAVSDLEIPEDAILQNLEDPNSVSNYITPALAYDTVNKLRDLPVPQELLRFHQLHIAALFAAANILGIQKTINSGADFEKDKLKYQEQYYQVALIQKIEAELALEIAALRNKYPELIPKYEITSSS